MVKCDVELFIECYREVRSLGHGTEWDGVSKKTQVPQNRCIFSMIDSPHPQNTVDCLKLFRGTRYTLSKQCRNVCTVVLLQDADFLKWHAMPFPCNGLLVS